jgi:hypothetical protein
VSIQGRPVRLSTNNEAETARRRQMPEFLLALYDPLDAREQFMKLSPEEMQAVVEKYRAWSDRLANAGHGINGKKLKDGSGRVVRRQGRQTRTLDGPFSESKEVLGGFFLVQARDYDEMLRLVQDCPHLDFGGTVEVREVEET